MSYGFNEDKSKFDLGVFLQQRDVSAATDETDSPDFLRKTYVRDATIDGNTSTGVAVGTINVDGYAPLAIAGHRSSGSSIEVHDLYIEMSEGIGYIRAGLFNKTANRTTTRLQVDVLLVKAALLRNVQA